jgi:antitoxin HigA-1
MPARRMNRRPTPPGEILLHEFMEPIRLSQAELARRLDISYPRVNEIIHGRRPITTDTACRLARLFGTSAELWVSLQAALDIWDLEHSKRVARELEKIEPLQRTA